ncbi:MAG: ABC transporter ATP-binding protein [Ethanoligenens sp.]
MWKLVHYLKPYRKECILGPLFKLFEAIFELLLPTLMVLVVNNGVGRHDRAYVLHIGLLMVIMAICGCASAFTCQFFAARASQGFGTVLRNDLFRHVSSLSLRQLDAYGTETLTNRLTNDVNTLQAGVAMAIRLLVRSPFICIGAIVMALILNWKLALILIFATPLFALLLFVFTKLSTPLYRVYQKGLDHVAVVVRENLAGVRVIRAFAKVPQEKRRFSESNDSLTATALRLGGISALLNPLTTLVVDAAILFVLWFGGRMVGHGTLMKGEIIAFVNYITYILIALIALSNLIILFTRCAASGRRVTELFDCQPDMEQAEGKVSARDEHAPAVVFDHVDFGYGGGKALEDINLEIQRGQTVGVIGGTGSGKSTFVSLIARFYDVTKGEIRLGGVPIRQLPDMDLRRNVCIAPQKTVLLTGTIADNIRVGRQDATDEQVKEAAKIAQAAEFIEKLPGGYTARVERGGTNFSGGQRQRIGVARAVLADADILILDDASSALDYSTDARMRGALRRARAGRTTILVSQRAASIQDADRILVLDNGRVAGFGTHESLQKECPAYRDILATQA